jgi:hypothetical protein
VSGEVALKASKETLEAVSQLVSQLKVGLEGIQATVYNTTTGLVSQVEQLSNQYTVKFQDIASGKVIASFGMLADSEEDVLDFMVMANRWIVVNPNDTDDVKSFFVINTQTGQVSFNMDLIASGSISGSKIIADKQLVVGAHVSSGIDSATIEDSNGNAVAVFSGGKITANLLSVTNAQFSGDIWSNNYVPGGAGWKMFRNGDAELNNVTIRGALKNTFLDIASSPYGLYVRSESTTKVTYGWATVNVHSAVKRTSVANGVESKGVGVPVVSPNYGSTGSFSPERACEFYPRVLIDASIIAAEYVQGDGNIEYVTFALEYSYDTTTWYPVANSGESIYHPTSSGWYNLSFPILAIHTPDLYVNEIVYYRSRLLIVSSATTATQSEAVHFIRVTVNNLAKQPD